MKMTKVHQTLPHSRETIGRLLVNGYNYKDIIKFAIEHTTEEMLVALVEGIEKEKRNE